MTVTVDEALTVEQRAVVEKIYELFRERSQWPMYGEVYRQLRRVHDFHVGTVFKSIPDTYVLHHRPMPMEPSPTDQVRLTLRGIAVCPSGEDDAKRLPELLRRLAEVERTFEPEPGQGVQPIVTAREVRAFLGLIPDDYPALGRLFWLLSIDNWGVTANGFTNVVEWYVNVNPEIYRFADVETIEDCLRVRAEWIAEAQAAAMTPRPNPYGYTLTAAEPEPEQAKGDPYVDEKTIELLRTKEKNGKFDLMKLLNLVSELNDNYANKNTYACLALARAILDHVPPILGCKNFDTVASSYGWGRTDKAYMRSLVQFKNNGDDVMHRQISAHEDLLSMADVPARVWINVLLRECAVKL